MAITFTNKAASEMRSRIIDWMKRIILDLPFKGSSLGPIDELMAGAAGQIDRAAVIHAVENDFEDLIRNFYDFKVSTIDSFVNLTLKASAFKLGLPPDFDISTESALYVDAMFQEFFQEILGEGEVRRRSTLFSGHTGDGRRECGMGPEKLSHRHCLPLLERGGKGEQGFYSRPRTGKNLMLRREIAKQDAANRSCREGRSEGQQGLSGGP